MENTKIQGSCHLPKTVSGGVKAQIGPALGKTVRLVKATSSLVFPLPCFWVAMILLSLALLQSRKRSHEDVTKATGLRIRRTKLGSCLGIFQPIYSTYLGESVSSCIERDVQTR